jgi:hypothetical protein
MEASDESLARIPLWREGNIVTVVDKLIKNGELVLVNERVFDLDRAANLIRYEHHAPRIHRADGWNCEYQQVDGVWVPKRTESTTVVSDRGLVLQEKTDWKDQVLNGEVAKELSPTTLGARRGDQAYNHKTKTLYRIKDAAYPAHQGRESADSKSAGAAPQ